MSGLNTCLEKLSYAVRSKSVPSVGCAADEVLVSPRPYGSIFVLLNLSAAIVFTHLSAGCYELNVG